MRELNRSRVAPYAHQVVGVDRLVEARHFLLADEMRLGKSKQVIDAAQILWTRGELGRVFVVSNAAGRLVWADQGSGQISAHLWEGLSAKVTEYHAKRRTWVAPAGRFRCASCGRIKAPVGRSVPAAMAGGLCDVSCGGYLGDTVDGAGNMVGTGPQCMWPGETSCGPGCSVKRMSWIVTNYEFIRKPDRLQPLLDLASKDDLLVLDETSAVKTHNAEQTRSCAKLRKRVGRAWLLNGTPVTKDEGDLYAQGALMDKSILGCKTWYEYRATYAVMGGYLGKQVLGWRHRRRDGEERCCADGRKPCCEYGPNHPVHGPGPGVEDIQARMAPHVLRRLKRDCLDLPPKLAPVTIPVRLSDGTWKLYKDMRDQAVAWLAENVNASAAQAGVRVMRLSQITSGFLGGLLETYPCRCCKPTTYDVYMTDEKSSFGGDLDCGDCFGSGVLERQLEAREVGREKLDALLSWLGARLEEDPQFKAVVWCRFRAELSRAWAAIKGLRKDLAAEAIYGGQGKEERLRALELLKPGFAPDGRAVLIGNRAAGGRGTDMAAASTVVNLSSDYNLGDCLQAEERVHGPGQVSPVAYFDLVAIGPDGQKTVDSDVMGALRRKENVASWTAGAWVARLTAEEGEPC